MTQVKQTDSRFWLTNDIAALLLIISLPGYVLGVGLGYLDLSAVPELVEYGYYIAVAASVVWLFGLEGFVADKMDNE